MDLFAAVRHLPLFEELSPREMELIAAQSHLKIFDKGELLFYEEEASPYWYYVVEGRLKLYKATRDEHEISLCNLEPGMAVNDLQRERQSYQAVNFATVEGVSVGSLIGIKAAAIPLLFTQIPRFPLLCFHAVLTSVERYQRAFYSGMVLDAMGKVAYMIATDLEKFNRMKKQEIAGLLNIQPETLSRLLGKLVRKEVISCNGPVKVTDMAALKSFYT